MSFDHDIFISYAHLDNLALSDGAEGWVSTFHQDLAALLAPRIARLPRIWRDRKLAGNDAFADALVEEVGRVGVFVSVLSPRYADSEWCRRELDHFARAAEATGGVRRGNRGRLFKVHKTWVDRARHPEPLRPFLGYDFFDRDPETGRTLEYDRRFGPELQQAYYRRLNDLVYDLAQILEDLDDEAPAAARPPGRVVYLAEATHDLREARDAVARDLKERGHVVLPDRTLPYTPGYEEAVRAALGRAELAVCLVGGPYGTVLEHDERSVVEVQARLAVARAAAGEAQALVWVAPAAGPPADPRQAAFLAWLRDEATVPARVDLLRGPLEELKALAAERLAPRRAVEIPFPARFPVGGAGRTVYLAETTTDLLVTREALARALAADGHTVLPERPLPYTPTYKDDVALLVSRAALSVHLVGAHYGTVPEGWDRSVVALQAEAAQEAAARGEADAVVWQAPGPPPGEDPRLDGLRAAMRQAAAGSERLRWVEGPLDALHERIAGLLRPPARVRDEATGAARAVYLVRDPADAGAAAALDDALFAAGLDVLLPLADGTPQALREDHLAAVEQADAAVVFYGEAGERWVRAQLRAISRALGVRGGRALPAFVWVAPPDDPAKARYRTHDATVLRGAGGPTAEALAPLLAALGAGAG